MKRFKDILCVLERGEASRPALECAVMLAEDNQASLTVVDVIPRVTAGIGMPDGGPISADLQAAMLSVHEARLKPLVDPYRKRIEIQTKVLAGTSFLEIVREVLRNGLDLVVKIPESPDWLDRLFWGDDMHLLRKCPCPVWIIKPQASKSYRRILAAVDVDESNPSEELGSRHALNRQILEMAAHSRCSNLPSCTLCMPGMRSSRTSSIVSSRMRRRRRWLPTSNRSDGNIRNGWTL